MALFADRKISGHWVYVSLGVTYRFEIQPTSRDTFLFVQGTRKGELVADGEGFTATIYSSSGSLHGELWLLYAGEKMVSYFKGMHDSSWGRSECYRESAEWQPECNIFDQEKDHEIV